jgi:hypothetical protein
LMISKFTINLRKTLLHDRMHGQRHG